MQRFSYLLPTLGLVVLACSDLDRTLPAAGGGQQDEADQLADDDDSASADDDDSASADDDDSAGVIVVGDPGEAFLGRSYCLDWDSVDFIRPAGLAGTLAGFGISLNNSRLILNPVAVDLAVGQLSMLAAVSAGAGCSPDPSLGVLDLTATQPGSYVPPHFAVGPQDLVVSVFNLYDAELEGDFTADASQIVAGSLVGLIDIDVYASVLCQNPVGAGSWPCVTCPAGGNCVELEAVNGVWTDSGLGPL